MFFFAENFDKIKMSDHPLSQTQQHAYNEFCRAQARLLELQAETKHIRHQMKKMTSVLEETISSRLEKRLPFTEELYFALAKTWKKSQPNSDQAMDIITRELCQQMDLKPEQAMLFAKHLVNQIFKVEKCFTGYTVTLRKSRKNVKKQKT